MNRPAVPPGIIDGLTMTTHATEEAMARNTNFGNVRRASAPTKGRRNRGQTRGLGSFPYTRPQRASVHVTATTIIGPLRTKHKCPECAYVSLVDWTTDPYTRLIQTPSDSRNPMVCHLDQREPATT